MKILLALTLLPCLVFADGGRSTHPVVELEYKIFAALRTRNSASVESFIADDFHLRMPRQPEIGKNEFLKSIRESPHEIVSVNGDELKTNIYGNVAVLTGIQRAVVSLEGGKQANSRGAFVDVFEKRGSSWMLVLAYSVEMPSQPAGAK
jgi:ketosteroid isomerase-like protein